MICVPIKGPKLLDVCEQIDASIPLADLVELRFDNFDSFEVNDLKEIRARFSIPMIFTLKGDFDEEFIQKIMKLEPEYVDIDMSVSSSLMESVLKKHPKTKRIISFHDFLGTPENLEEIYEKMRQVPAYFYKIAVTARNCLDLAKLLNLSKKSDGRLIAISMGALGQPSRILAKTIRSPLTYSALKEGDESAPGQLLTNTLTGQYRYRSINAETRIYGLIGNPVSLSISNETHNHWMQVQGLNTVYVKIQVATDELESFLNFSRDFPFHGLSVTMPLKEKVLECLDDIDDDAKRIGAVNTLVIKDGKVKGFNTDGLGALNALERRGNVRGKRILLLGAGGASKAIAYEAKKRGAEVVILNRSPDKAYRLAENLGCMGGFLEEMHDYFEQGYDILINCTPIPLPISPEYLLPEALVMDIVTRPKETSFLKAAKGQGCSVVYGYEMFVEQALGQFHLWFNRSEGRDVLEEKALSCLEDR